MSFFTENYYTLLLFWIGLAFIIFFVLFFVKSAEYGKFYKTDSELQIDNKLGWIIMESPTIVLLPLYFICGPNELNLAALIILGLYLLHYINRTLVFPFRLKTKGKKMPVQIVVSAIIFNVINTFFLGYYFGFLHQIDNEWLISLPFIIGVIIFISGMIINVHSDNILLKLRSSSTDKTYHIPNGGFYKWVSSPNYFGEFIEWCGYALLTFSLPGLAFAVWTFANLGPRAHSNHKWYKGKFEHYPKERKAMIPFLF